MWAVIIYLSLESEPIRCTSSFRNKGWSHCCVDEIAASFANGRMFHAAVNVIPASYMWGVYREKRINNENNIITIQPQLWFLKSSDRLTRASVCSHAVFVIISKVGLIIFPWSVWYRCSIHPAENGEETMNNASGIRTFCNSFRQKFDGWLKGASNSLPQQCGVIHLNDLSKFTVMPMKYCPLSPFAICRNIVVRETLH